jgi:hypothetical protein
MTLLSGCLSLGGTERVALNLTDFLPAEWQPVGELRTVDIDSDATTEYLLFYTYDQVNGSGPTGALILDPQTETVVDAQGQLARDRPTIFPNPYALLPSYWQGAGQGFIAAPGQQEAVSVYQVAYQTTGLLGQVAKPDTLIVRGGNTYLTFAWWQNVIDGYGVTQLYAPGGFEGLDWEVWARSPTPITSIIGSTPLNNRSLFCRKTRYDRAAPTPPPANIYRPSLVFVPTDLGLFFCAGSPAHPFYPEGVVLAYLRHAERRTALLAEPTAQSTIDGSLNLSALLLVDEAVGYRTVADTLTAATARGDQVKTSVCANLLYQEGNQAVVTRQIFLFVLEHHPPRLDPPTPARLLIATVNPLPAPSGQIAVQCHDFIDQD